MRIFLIRHGESQSDMEDRYGGDYNDHLTAKGRKQAEKAAGKLESKGITMIFSSPKLRAKEAAEILIKTLNCRMQIMQDLRERNRYGVLTGMKKSEAAAKHSGLVQILKDEKKAIKGAESYEHFHGRVISAFSKIKKETKGVHQPCIAIVSHGGPIKLIMKEIMKKPIERDLKDCEIIEVDV